MSGPFLIGSSSSVSGAAGDPYRELEFCIGSSWSPFSGAARVPYRELEFCIGSSWSSLSGAARVPYRELEFRTGSFRPPYREQLEFLIGSSGSRSDSERLRCTLRPRLHPTAPAAGAAPRHERAGAARCPPATAAGTAPPWLSSRGSPGSPPLGRLRSPAAGEGAVPGAESVCPTPLADSRGGEAGGGGHRRC